MIEQRSFGQLASGDPVLQFIIRNDQGSTLEFTNYGGIITALRVPDRKGELADVVLGFDELASYEAGHPFFGAIIGRNAGRLPGGAFTLAGRNYELELNDGPHHLHGGSTAFDKKVWSARIVDEQSVQLSDLSPDGDSGYPGNVAVSVVYTWTEENCLRIDYEATTDSATPLNLTNHSYFNLAGEGNGTIEDHRLQVLATEITPTNELMTPLGRVESIRGRENDLREPRRIGDVLPGLLNQHGDNYHFTPGSHPVLRPVANLFHPGSGRHMEVLTTEQCLQFYSGVSLDGSAIGKSGRVYGRLAGLCLECQGFPDGPNHPEVQDTILRPGGSYRQRTEYRFTNLASNTLRAD